MSASSADDQFWGSMIHTLLFIISMTIIPVLIGLVLAALLFDYVRDQFGERLSSFFRAGFYLPQILPVTTAGVLWGWILSPIGVANIILKAIGLGALAQNWIGDATFALPAVSADDRLDPGRLLPRGVHGRSQPHRPRALRGGRSSMAPAGGSGCFRSPCRCWRPKSSSSC